MTNMLIADTTIKIFFENSIQKTSLCYNFPSFYFLIYVVYKRVTFEGFIGYIQEYEIFLFILSYSFCVFVSVVYFQHLASQKTFNSVIDLENKLNIYIEDAIKISIKDNTGIEEIKNRITEIFKLDKISTNDMSYLSNARSISLLKQSLNKINECLNNIQDSSPIDIIELDLKECWSTLGEIIGETYTDELIDEIFSRFCLGK